MRLYCLLILIAMPVIFSGCYVNSHIMLKTDRNFVYDTLPEKNTTQYKISPNDVISFRLFANDGFRLIDMASGLEGDGGNNRMMFRSFMSYLVETDGTARLPIVGPTKLAGYTIREAEFYLEGIYSEYYVKPFVQVQVTNKRVIVFPGGGGDAKVITLENNNTTLIEVLALAGGLSGRGRAAKIKLMRKDENNVRKVYLIDLSTIEGLKYVDMVVQANDYVYVQPVPQVGTEVMKDLAPIISILSSAILVYSVIQRF